MDPTSSNYRQYPANQGYSNHYQHIVDEHDPYEWTVMQGPRDGDRTAYDPVLKEYATS